MNAPLRTLRRAETISDLTEAERTRILAKSALFNPPPHVLADGRRDLVGLSRAELADEIKAIGEAPFRVKQIWHWIYHQGFTDFFPHEFHRQAVAAETGGEIRDRAAGGDQRADER